MQDDNLPFVLGGTKFDLTTFYGRWRNCLQLTDSRILLTPRHTLEKHAKLIQQYKSDKDSIKATNGELWEAQRVYQAVYHPDTGEKILAPFRMCGFVPFGSILVIGLLIPNQPFAAVAFWQWMNQSHNACVNYANRNASKETPMSQFLKGYAAAVTSAVSIGLGLTVAVRRATGLAPTAKTAIERFLPLPAVSVASTCNLFFMRRQELSTGIEIYDSNKNVIGTSKAAARKAIKETAITRAFLPLPVFLIPSVAMMYVDKTLFIKKFPRMSAPINALVCIATFGVFLPISLAMFPQESSLSKDELEPELQKKCIEQYAYYNKGL